MTHVFGILLLLLAIILHEAGHAITMMRRGVDIKEAGIGFPIKKCKLTVRPKWLPFPVILGPVLVGAYVMPSDVGAAKLKSMRYKDQASCYGAGVIMNLLFATSLLVIAGACTCLAPGYDHQHDFIVMLCALGAFAAVFLLRRWLSLIMPVFGVLFMALVVALLFQSTDNVGGPGSTIGASAGASSWIDALSLGANLSLGLGLFNALPFVPLDGGKIVTALLQAAKWARLDQVFTYATAVVFSSFIVFLIVKDIYSI
ncbi:MAG: hypothetical protein JWN38_1103 [Candidatus Saccharibacteria bacterium]|nr:hypothetical protein [Candidatus Saccharibacteria bacterium]